jgi:hypothetical protein
MTKSFGIPKVSEPRLNVKGIDSMLNRNQLPEIPAKGGKHMASQLSSSRSATVLMIDDSSEELESWSKRLVESASRYSILKSETVRGGLDDVSNIAQTRYMTFSIMPLQCKCSTVRASMPSCHRRL